MHPELFKIPFINLTIQSFGTMMVMGFLAALVVMRRMAKSGNLNSESLSNAALYALIAGLAGAKLMYVVHHYDQFRDGWHSIFSGWGFELLGGVITSILFLVVYLRKKKMPLLQCFDILAVGLMVGIGFGRIGCFLNGCCYGKITNSPVGIRFPYDSIAYNSQVRPDTQRHRSQPHLHLDSNFFGWLSGDGTWRPASETDKYQAPLKPYTMLTKQQKQQVDSGPYRCLKVHPTQLYETGYTFVLAGGAYLFWRSRYGRKAGLTTASVMWIYAVLRFINEGLRDDNPFEEAWWAVYRGGTISQNISIYLIIIGTGLTLFLLLKKAGNSPGSKKRNSEIK